MEKHKVAIMGLGHWYIAFAVGRAAIESSLYEIVGVSDPRKEKLKEFCDTFKVKPYEDYRELLKNENIEIVVIVPPTLRIPEYTIAAAEAGKHILMGKPMAMSLKEADQALRAVKKAGIKLVAFEAMVRLGKPPKDTIGDILAISTVMHQGIAEDWFRSGTPGWFADPTQVPGGAFIDEGIYVIEAHRFCADSEVKRVDYARTANLIFKDIQVEDFGQASLTFENGVISSMEISWTISQPKPRNRGSLTKANAFTYTTIIGSDGEIVDGGLLVDRAVLSKEFPYWVIHRPRPEISARPAFQALDYLIECIEKDEKPVASGEDARKSLEVALAVYKSAKTGKPVTLPL